MLTASIWLFCGYCCSDHGTEHEPVWMTALRIALAIAAAVCATLAVNR